MKSRQLARAKDVTNSRMAFAPKATSAYMSFPSRMKPTCLKTRGLRSRFWVDASMVRLYPLVPGRLWLATSEDLGKILQRAVLLVDATALLEGRKLRIESAN